MDELGFVDVWTPSMTRGTPEGARDFLVPVRLQPGKFFALAQSPQLFKQLCMIGGFDRYYQIATCWRDEDLRADRQFEFRQLDLEMAFVEREDVIGVMEAAVVGAFEAVGRPAPARPFPWIPYDEAMLKYGTDKPDLRFGLEIQEATGVTRGSESASSPARRAVRFLVAPKAFSRAELDAARGAREGVGGEGACVPRPRRRRGALADREVPSEPELAAFAAPDGSTVALRRRRRGRCLARARPAAHSHLARELDLIDTDIDVFHWVIDFPLFERTRKR